MFYNFLIFCYFLIVANQLLYYFINNPNRHFANNYHFTKELALALKTRCFRACNSPKFAKRLRFYGIKNSNKFYLKALKQADKYDMDKKIVKVKLGKYEKVYQILNYD